MANICYTWNIVLQTEYTKYACIIWNLWLFACFSIRTEPYVVSAAEASIMERTNPPFLSQHLLINFYSIFSYKSYLIHGAKQFNFKRQEEIGKDFS